MYVAMVVNGFRSFGVWGRKACVAIIESESWGSRVFGTK